MGHVVRSNARKLIFGWTHVEWGGAQIYLLNLMRAAADTYDVRVVLPAASDPGMTAYLDAEGVRTEPIAAYADLRPAATLAARLRRRRTKYRAERDFLRHIVARTAPSALLHVDVAPWTSYRLVASLARRNPTFVTLHTRLPSASAAREWLWRRRWQRLFATPGFHLLAGNRDARDSLVPYVGEAAAHRVPVAYSGVDLDEIARARADTNDRARWRRELGVPADGVVIAGAGQFIERKGCWTFLEAAAQLCGQDPRPHFVWLATAPLSPAAQDRLDSTRPPRFHLLPATRTGSNRESFLNALDALTDIFALPSFLEGLPLVLVEVMALGKPTVASAVNAVPEAIDDGNNGVLAPAGDADRLAAALAALVRDPDQASRLGDAAKRTAVERFDQRRTSAITLEAYRHAVGPR